MRRVVSSMAKRNVRSEVSPSLALEARPPLFLLPSSSPFLSSSPLTIVRAKERELSRSRTWFASIAMDLYSPNLKTYPAPRCTAPRRGIPKI